MKPMFSSLVKRAITAAVILHSVSAQSAITTVQGNIAALSNGWGGEGYYITLKNQTGPSGCTNAVGYIALPSRNDQKQIIATAMLAMSLNATVRIAFEGCTGGVGTIFGLEVYSL